MKVSREAAIDSRVSGHSSSSSGMDRVISMVYLFSFTPLLPRDSFFGFEKSLYVNGPVFLLSGFLATG